jgi:hypothetical protein
MAKGKSRAGDTIKRLERGASMASQRLARAVELGLDQWQSQRKKSSLKRRDGAIRDALKNSALAAGTLVKEASWAPSDLFRAFGRRRDPRRRFLRALLPL